MGGSKRVKQGSGLLRFLKTRRFGKSSRQLLEASESGGGFTMPMEHVAGYHTRSWVLGVQLQGMANFKNS